MSRHPIVAGYDGSVASKHALAYAAGLARRADRWLVVMNISRLGCLVPSPQTLLAELGEADLTGLDIEIVSRTGDPAAELIRATAERQADAIVLGASHRPPLWSAPWSVAGRVARRTLCPAVVVP